MDSEAKIIIAFLFNRSGKNALTEAELYLPLSMDLSWFSTKDAQGFITYAVQQKLLTKKNGLLHPTFPLETITIPLGFTPSKKQAYKTTEPGEEEPVFTSLVSLISQNTNRDQNEVLDEISRAEQEKQLLPEIAALLVAKKNNLCVVEWIDRIENTIFAGKRE